MPFDWIKFLEHHQIEYVTHGPSVVRGNVAVHCPYCGTADPSHHMGISLAGHGWGCWRNRAHRGRNPTRLVASLLSISLSQARTMLGYTDASVPDGNLRDRVNILLRPSTTSADTTRTLTFPPEIKRLDWATCKPSMFFDYLYSRHYTREEAEWACQKFWLRYALTGEFSYRLIFPIRNEEGQLISWTGRAIAPDQTVRYKTLSVNKGTPRALAPATDFLLREHQLHGGPVLVVCEGPFDAMRIETVCADLGVSATCLFTKTASEMQIAKLGVLSKRFRNKFLLLDQDAALSSLSVLERLRGFGYKNLQLPGHKDPAATPTNVLQNLIKEHSHGN